MYTLDPLVLHRCLSYSDLFEKKLSTKEVAAFVQSLDMYNSISIICELLTLRDKKIKRRTDYLFSEIKLSLPFDGALKLVLLEHCKTKKIALSIEAKKLLNPLNNSVKLITLQSLLHALKALLAYGKYDWSDNHPKIEKADYGNIILLALIALDMLSVEDLNPSHFIYGNYQLNQYNNVGSEICRAYYMYCILGKSPSSLSTERQNQWIDINADFVKTYGYSINHYLATLFLLVEREFSDQDKLAYYPIYMDLATAFSKTDQPASSNSVIIDLSIDPQELQPWAKDTLFSWWDYSGFLEHPILQTPSDHFISICDKTIINSLYDKLYWQVRSCYPQENIEIIGYIGLLFEKYVQEITEQSVSNTSNCRYISEFFYHTPTSDHNASSDAYIVNGNKMIVIEAKSYFPLFDSITKTDDEKIKKTIEKLFIKPVLQADKANSAIAITCPSFFDGIDEVFIISVTAQGLGAVPEYYNYALQEIAQKKIFSKHKYSVNMGIGEYEYFLSMLENNVDVFFLLEKYCSQTVLQPFMLFSNRETGYTAQRTKQMEKLFLTSMQELHDILFPNDKG